MRTLAYMLDLELFIVSDKAVFDNNGLWMIDQGTKQQDAWLVEGCALSTSCGLYKPRL